MLLLLSLKACDGKGLTGAGQAALSHLTEQFQMSASPAPWPAPHPPARKQPGLKFLPLCTDPGVLLAHLTSSPKFLISHQTPPSGHQN